MSAQALDGRQPESAAGPADDDVAAAVQDFYERYPYPPPADDLDNYRRSWQDPNRRRADFHLFWPDKPYSEERTILIAGCGTSQAAKHALRCPAARVVGIDFSATSVRHTEDLRRKYDLTNSRSISCRSIRSATWRRRSTRSSVRAYYTTSRTLRRRCGACVTCSPRDGAMHLMVYAPYGRAGIYMLQEFCRGIGIQASDVEIRDLAAALGALPARHPLARLLHEAPDFRQEAALADALLNPRDRAYSVPQFLDLLSSAGLTFSRWVRQAPYSPGCGVMVRLPQASRIAALEPAQQYAAAELFRGTMMSHSAIACRDDRPGRSQAIGFSGDAWLDFRASSSAGHTLHPGAAAPGRRGGPDQPGSYRHRYLLADRCDGRNSSSMPSTASAASARSRATSHAMPAARCSSGSGGTIRLCSMHREAESPDAGRAERTFICR